MKTIELTQGKVALVDDEDFEWLSQWSWAVEKDARSDTYYAARTGVKADGDRWQKRIKMHREIMNTPKGREVDHVDYDGINNQKYNLRNCTNQQNQGNQRPQKGRSSRFKGVSWNKLRQSWSAVIKRDYVRRFLGYFNCEIEAAKAYDEAAKTLHGDFAYLNFINGAENEHTSSNG